MRGRSSFRLCALVAALTAGVIILLTSCQNGSASAGGQGCPPVAGVEPDQLTFGLLFPTTGASQSTFVPYRTGIDARLGLVNAAGGINGRQVHYVWEDDTGTASGNLAGAQRLVNADHAFALQEFSPTPQGSAPWLNSQRIPVVGTSDEAVWSKYDNMFSYFNVFTGGAASVTTWGVYAQSQNTHKAAVMVSPLDSSSRAFSTELSDSMHAAGIPTQPVQVDGSNLDTDEIVAQIRASGADMLTGDLDATQFVTIALAARAAMPTIKILSPVGYDQGILAVGKQLAGMGVFTAYWPFESPVPAQKTFLRAMELYAPQQQQPANEIALSGYIDTDLLLRGLQAAGRCPTRQSFITGLRNVHDFTASGLLPKPIDMRAIFGQLTLCYSFLQISADGSRFVPIQPTSLLCGSRVE
jgi:branched-chain amino acid transport system substrate-binding protein